MGQLQATIWDYEFWAQNESLPSAYRLKPDSCISSKILKNKHFYIALYLN